MDLQLQCESIISKIQAIQTAENNPLITPEYLDYLKQFINTVYGVIENYPKHLHSIDLPEPDAQPLISRD